MLGLANERRLRLRSGESPCLRYILGLPSPQKDCARRRPFGFGSPRSGTLLRLKLALVATDTYVICDKARCYRSKAVQTYHEPSRVKLLFLPPHAPNPNRIERFWKFLEKKTLYNRYYETFADFNAVGEGFFAEPLKYRAELRSLLTVSLEIVG